MNTRKTTKAARIAIAAAIAGAVALPASGALAASKTERAIIGALLGGVAGAAVSDGDGAAVAIGAVAGAALGSATAKDKRYHAGYRQTRPYYANNNGYQAYDQRRGNRGYYNQTYANPNRYDRYDRYDRDDRYDGRRW